ncbi:hypothetical protein [Bacillus nitroreducens]
MIEVKRERVCDVKAMMFIHAFTTMISLILFVYLTITDNMVVAPFFFMSVSLCFFISGIRFYKKNRIVAQLIAFFIVGTVLLIVALQDLLQYWFY